MVFSCSPAAIVNRNHFFSFAPTEKSSESTVKFRQAGNHCERVVEAVKLAYATKTRVHCFPENWLSGLYKSPIVFSTKLNLL